MLRDDPEIKIHEEEFLRHDVRAMSPKTNFVDGVGGECGEVETDLDSSLTSLTRFETTNAFEIQAIYHLTTQSKFQSSCAGVNSRIMPGVFRISGPAVRR
jgi:hypothetical protein